MGSLLFYVFYCGQSEALSSLQVTLKLPPDKYMFKVYSRKGLMFKVLRQLQRHY